MATATADPPKSPSPQSVLNALRGEGLRISTVRRIVVNSMFAAREPLSAEQLAAGSDDSPRLDLASVYRNLETLETHGVVQRLRVGDGPARYVLVRARGREYLACDRCGALEEIAAEELDGLRAVLRERFGYEVSFSRFPAMGVCQRCS
jgi:Fur family ferric uptake transcriptional regulator